MLRVLRKCDAIIAVLLLLGALLADFESTVLAAEVGDSDKPNAEQGIWDSIKETLTRIKEALCMSCLLKNVEGWGIHG